MSSQGYTIKSTDEFKPIKRNVVLRRVKPDSVVVDGRTVEYVPLGSGLILPVSTDTKDDLADHTHLIVQAFGSEVDDLEVGMRAIHQPSPFDIELVDEEGTEYVVTPRHTVVVAFKLL